MASVAARTCEEASVAAPTHEAQHRALGPRRLAPSRSRPVTLAGCDAWPPAPASAHPPRRPSLSPRAMPAAPPCPPPRRPPPPHPDQHEHLHCLRLGLLTAAIVISPSEIRSPPSPISRASLPLFLHKSGSMASRRPSPCSPSTLMRLAGDGLGPAAAAGASSFVFPKSRAPARFESSRALV